MQKVGNVRRFWDNKLSNIDGWECFMYDSMTNTDKSNKDRVNHRYYRYYNDGDFPRGLRTASGMTINKYMGESIIEEALEKTAENNARYLIKKYMNAENRKAFYNYEYFQNKTYLIGDIQIGSNFDYWYAKNRILAKIAEDKWVIKSAGVYKKLCETICKISGGTNYNISYILRNEDKRLLEVPSIYATAFSEAVYNLLHDIEAAANAIEKQYGYVDPFEINNNK